MFHDLRQDFRYALRQIARTPGFAATAVLVIGLGIGANAAIFGLLNGLLFRPPAVTDPASLVWLTIETPTSSRPSNLSYPEYLDWRDRCDAFSGLAAYDRVPVTLSGTGEPERIPAEVVSGNYFTVLGVSAARGRVLGPEDDRPGAPPVAVISDALWRRRFGSDPRLIGTTLTLNGQPVTVIGVTPPRFRATELDPADQIWLPIEAHARTHPHLRELLAMRDAAWLRVFGRLRDGVTPDQARAELETLVRGAEPQRAERQAARVALTPLRGTVHVANRGEVVSIVGLLLAGSGFVLLIACANVANLLLARAAGRGREVGIRRALGATRGRLLRQLLTESIVLSLLGGAAALLLCFWAGDLLMAVGRLPADIAEVAAPDMRVLVFGLIVALAAGGLFGIAPALHATRPDPMSALRDLVPAPGSRLRGSRLQRLFVITQVALSLVLLVGAGLMLRSLRKATAVDPGFDAAGTFAVTFDLELQGYEEERRRLFERQAVERISALPGVEAASLATLLPLSGRMLGTGVYLEGSTDPESFSAMASVNSVEPGYFRTLRIPLRRGRDFTRADDRGAPGVVVVNETAARTLWPDREALGQRLSLSGPEGPWLGVIGVAGDGKYDELTEAPRPFVYLAHLQDAGGIPEDVVVARATGDPAALLEAARREIRALDPNLPLQATTLAATVANRNDKGRAMSGLLGAFGLLALTLASMGLYGVTAFTVVRRRREIGIRVALGARQGDVLRLFVGEGVRLALVGVVAGLLLAVAMTRVLAGLLFGITPTDVATFGGVAALLLGVAAAASWFPAHGAARTDPATVLRSE